MSKHIIEVKFQLILSGDGDGEIDLKVGSMTVSTYERIENDPRFRRSYGHLPGGITTLSNDPNRAVETHINFPRECLQLLAFHFANANKDGEQGSNGEGGKE